MELNFKELEDATKVMNTMSLPMLPSMVDGINGINGLSGNCLNGISSISNMSMLNNMKISMHSNENKSEFSPTLNSISASTRNEIQYQQFQQLQQLQQLQKMQQIQRWQIQMQMQMKQMTNTQIQNTSANTHSANTSPRKQTEPLPVIKEKNTETENTLDPITTLKQTQLQCQIPADEKEAKLNLKLPEQKEEKLEEIKNGFDENIVSIIGGRVVLIPSIQSLQRDLFPQSQHITSDLTNLYCLNGKKRRLKNSSLKRSRTTFEPRYSAQKITPNFSANCNSSNPHRSSARHKTKKQLSSLSLSKRRSVSCGALTVVKE